MDSNTEDLYAGGPWLDPVPPGLLTTSAMYAADRDAMAAGVPGTALMENAGRAVALAAWDVLPDGPVAVLCGPGNNGGDGFVAARYLRAWGRSVRLALLGRRESLRGDAAHHAARWDGEVQALDPAVLDGCTGVVDALFGAGLTRPLDGAPAALAEAAAARGLPVVAVDVPSGVHGDHGAVVGEVAFQADVTVTFGRARPGHWLYPGRRLRGRLRIADIGLPESVLAARTRDLWRNDPALWGARWPWRDPETHKYRHGHAVVFGGGEMTGAGRLAARAALRAGAGLVTAAVPAEAVPLYALTAASLLVVPLAHEATVDTLLDDPRRNAVLFGPGAGIGCAGAGRAGTGRAGAGEATRTRALALLQSGRALVLDADALTALAEVPAALAAAVTGPTVLTPHPGEFARLFPDLTGDKLTQARAAAARCGCVVLLKGADSVVAAPDGRAAINANAPATLATAGAGDVLAGVILGALAQGLDAFDAASAGVWLHGAAAAHFGPGLIADDVVEGLPGALAALARLEQGAKGRPGGEIGNSLSS